jgi:broad specificity phosphatase PhoE
VTTLSATTVLLIRHAHTDALGRCLSGRSDGVPLSTEGRTQADRLGRALASRPLAAIYTSPLDRAVQTAEALARYQTLAVSQVAELLEIDFGGWTGQTFIDLDRDPAWQRFNASRSTACIPDGERLANVQARIVAAIRRLGTRHPGKTIALVSHADVLRVALLHYVGATLDDYARFDVAPASVTALSLTARETRVVFVNRQPGVAASGAPYLEWM